MSKSSKLRVVSALLLGVLMLSACLNTPAAEPTADINAIYTQAAETLSAQLTQTAMAMPTATFTPAPSNTPAVTPTPMPTLPPLGTQPAVGTSLPSLATATQALVQSPDAAVWVSQVLEDGKVFDTNFDDSALDQVWVLKNTGTTTWTKDYQYRFYAGDKLHQAAAYNLKEDVKPGGEVKLFLDVDIPTTPGEYNTIWVITNKDGRNFYTFNWSIKVVKAGDPTPAP